MIAGRHVGPYRLLERVGSGAMAEVFRAEHRHLGQIRGLKVLPLETDAQPELLSRLLSEARVMARLRHPNIAEVYDCDVQGDSAFIVLEYLPGITLRTWSEHVGKLSRNPGLAAAIVGTLADALAFAHQHGIVHRDLKPENVVLVPVPHDRDRFTPKILDFGVAKLLREQPAAAAPGGSSAAQSGAITQHGYVVGTPLYMAPEQCAGDPIDHRADVYALGCVLFELLCGRPPFGGDDAAAIMWAHLLEPPADVTRLEPEIPRRFQTLLARMLAKSPDDRPGSMDEVLCELEAISRRPRSTWKKVLRTPVAGATTIRRPLVIDLEKTQVDEITLSERIWLSLRRACKRVVRAKATRLGLIAAASVAAGGSMLLSTRLLLPRNQRAPTELVAPPRPPGGRSIEAPAAPPPAPPVAPAAPPAPPAPALSQPEGAAVRSSYRPGDRPARSGRGRRFRTNTHR